MRCCSCALIPHPVIMMLCSVSITVNAKGEVGSHNSWNKASFPIPREEDSEHAASPPQNALLMSAPIFDHVSAGDSPPSWYAAYPCVTKVHRDAR